MCKMSLITLCLCVNTIFLVSLPRFSNTPVSSSFTPYNTSVFSGHTPSLWQYMYEIEPVELIADTPRPEF